MDSSPPNHTSLDSLLLSHPPLSPSLPPLLPTSTTTWSDALWWWFLVPYVSSETLYWVTSLVFAALDFLLPPSTLALCKLQPSRLPASSPSKVLAYRDAFRLAASNHILGSIPTLLLFTGIAHHLQLPLHCPLPPLFPTLLLQVVTLLLVEEVAFYYSHRLLHLPFLYQRVHHIHHEWVAPVAVSATTCHLLEHIVSNVAPMLLGVLVARAHWTLYMGWVWLGVFNTVCVHSGYAWGWLKALNHDRHHSTFKCHYGAIGLLDWAHGTRYSDLVQQRAQEGGDKEL